ncbi:MAG TPA: hypothetical protein VFD84_19140 [Candidatus Binatia bacterium]|jgi:hypothetical protein|nr:hypothetical protein [Candidatus Binatia bacterium]
MSRETADDLHRTFDAALAAGAGAGDYAALVARLERTERAYRELLERVRRYERERVELKGRVARILATLDGIPSVGR